MKVFLWSLLLVCTMAECFGQLVRRKDYDAAFALQGGGETSVLFPMSQPHLSICPIGGLKMTFPFTRKWFLGSEVNYSELKYRTVFSGPRYTSVEKANEGFQGKTKADFHLRQLQWPVYIKYMLNCNRASVLFGFYGAYVFRAKAEMMVENPVVAAVAVTTGKSGLQQAVNEWNAGITVGYEYQLVKHLNLMCRVSAGMRELLKAGEGGGKKWHPAQICITLSYDIFRVGDCGCD